MWVSARWGWGCTCGEAALYACSTLPPAQHVMTHLTPTWMTKPAHEGLFSINSLLTCLLPSRLCLLCCRLAFRKQKNIQPPLQLICQFRTESDQGIQGTEDTLNSCLKGPLSFITYWPSPSQTKRITHYKFWEMQMDKNIGWNERDFPDKNPKIAKKWMEFFCMDSLMYLVAILPNALANGNIPVNVLMQEEVWNL